MERPSVTHNPKPGAPSAPVDQPDAPPRRRRLFPWCWPSGSRLLLAVVALTAGLALSWKSREIASGPIIDKPPLLLLDPNTAPPRALEGLPRIGPALARRIVAAREERPFTSLDDLRDRVRGIGPLTIARLAPHLRIETVQPSTPKSVQAEKAAIPGAPRNGPEGRPAGSIAANAPIR